MSLTVGSLSSGSMGPSPIISSRISVTKSSSSWALSARRSATVYCETSAWTCRRTSSSGIFSSAERLISSISRRCRRTLASSSFSLIGPPRPLSSGAGSGSADGASGASAGAAAAGTASGADTGSGATMRREVKRPSMLILVFGRSVKIPSPGPQHAARAPRPALGHLWACLGFGRREQELLEAGGDIVARPHFLERNAAIDCLAHQAVVVGNHAAEHTAQRLLDVAAAQPRPEQLLLEAIDDHSRLRAALEALADRDDQLLGVADARHRHRGADEQPIGAEQHAVGPGEPGPRHVDHDILEPRGHHVEQAGDHVGIERAHLGGPVRSGNHGKAGGVL